MSRKRLFTLGCSYTKHWYPTWADWLGSEFNYYENLGLGGFGNRGILNRLSELIYKRKINDNDTIVVAWSTPIREDRYFSDKGWVPLGNIYNQKFYSEEWVKKYYDPFMGLMETINYIHAANLMLSNVKCKFAVTFMMKPNEIDSLIEINDAKTYVELCDPKNKLDDYLSYVLSECHVIDIDIHKFCKEYSSKNNIPYALKNLYQTDFHPSPLSHYFYTKEIISKHLDFDNFDESGKMLVLANEWSEYVSNYPRKTLEPIWPKNNNSTFTQLHFL